MTRSDRWVTAAIYGLGGLLYWNMDAYRTTTPIEWLYNLMQPLNPVG